MKSDFLPHMTLEGLTYGYGSRVCMYAITNEAWRRGLTVKLFKHESTSKLLYYNIESQSRSHTFNRSRGDLVTKEAVNICRNKELTKHYLANNNIPTPIGKRFDQAAFPYEQQLQYAEEIGFPVVIKPVNGSLGNGVISNIISANDLINALNYVCKELKYTDIIIEKYFKGEDYRIYVVGGKVVGAIKRVPANITGNGKDTISDLIQKKNKDRKNNPYLSKGLIRLDFEVTNAIKRNGFTLDTILNKNHVLYLREKCNASSGGDTFDVTDQLSSTHQQIAVNAISAIPGLMQGGVDILINSEGFNGQTASILEINSRAEIGIHLFPSHGAARDIPSAIIDHYFPESVGNGGVSKRSKLYYNLESALLPIKTGTVKEVVLTAFPDYEINAKKLIISGSVQGVGYRKWIKKEAQKCKINGFVKNVPNGNVVIVIAGSKENISYFKNKCAMGPSKAKVVKIEEKAYHKPILNGFYIE